MKTVLISTQPPWHFFQENTQAFSLNQSQAVCHYTANAPTLLVSGWLAAGRYGYRAWLAKAVLNKYCSCYKIRLPRRVYLGFVSQYQIVLYKYWSQLKQRKKIFIFNVRVKLIYLLFKLRCWASFLSNCLLFSPPSKFCSRRISFFANLASF